MSIEGGHWYLPDGQPFYEIAAKDGHMRPVTIRDARKVGAVPSVTTVLAIVAKPQLTAWMVKQGVLAALTLPRNADESEIDWLARVDADGREQAKRAAEEGSRIHDAIEQHYRHLPVPEQYRPHVAATVAEIERLFPRVRDWVPEAHFAHSDGFGGRVDLHSPSTGVVIDYKGKDGDFTDGKKLAYDQHWQLAGYQRGLNLTRAPCASIFVSRTHRGAVASHVWSEAEIAGGEAVFTACLRLWQAIKGYIPAFA